MPDPAERFIDAAVSPLAENAELEVAARYKLAEAIEMAGSAEGDSLDTAAEQLERSDRKPHGKWWRMTLYSVTALVSAGILANSAISAFLFRQTMELLGTIGSMSPPDPDAMHERMSRGLTPSQKLLLLGDTRHSGKADRFKALWDSEPENPLYFADYTTAHLSEKSSLPPDYLETARAIDPDNAWFTILAAAETARQSIDPSYSSRTTSPGGVKLKPVKDAAKLDEALALLHEAVPQKRFDNYQIALLKQRIPLLPKRTDSLDQWVPMSYVAGLTAPGMRLRYLADGVSAKAIQLAADKDAEGFKRLLDDWQAFIDTYVRADHGNLVDVLVAVGVVRAPLKAFHEAATDLGLPEQAARAKELDDRFERWKTATRAHKSPNDEIALRSSLLGGLSLPVVSKQSMRAPVITPEELEPGRLADHALAGRLLSLAAWLLLGLTVLAAGLYRFRGSLLTRQLSDRLTGLLRPGDWMMLFAIGVVLPLLYHLAISRFTPLGGREWSLKASAFLLPAGQFSSLLWLMIVLPVIVARRCLAKRGAAVGMAGGKQPVAWIAVLLGAAALPVFGKAFLGETPTQTPFIVAGCLLGLLQLYGLVIGIRALFSRQAGLLRRATIARVLMPAYAAGMLAMMLAVLLYHAEEKHWISRDRLSAVTVEAPAMGRFEYDVTQAMKQELLELVTGEP
jgi:hypothetical protein